MNKKLLIGAIGTLLLITTMPLASAAPHATVVIDPRTVYCQVTPIVVRLGDLTIDVQGDCLVIVDYYGNVYQCSTPPRTLHLGTITVWVRADCSVLAYIPVV